MKDRLIKIFSDTAKSRIAKSIGVGSTTIDSLYSRGEPKNQVFPGLFFVHRVSLDYLWFGVGQPYFVSRSFSDNETARMIPGDFCVNFLRCGGDLLFVFHKISVFNKVEFQEIRILDGVVGSETAKILHEVTTPVSDLSPSEFHEIKSGVAGNNLVTDCLDRANTSLLLDEWVHGEKYYENELLNAVRNLDEKHKSIVSEVAHSYISADKP